MITQVQLQRHRDLLRDAEEYKKQVEASRKQIIEQAHAGEPAEEGCFRMKLEERESRSFSYDGMVDIVGRKTADFLKDQLVPKKSEVLTVTGP